ncbi:MAG: membrane associated rhomboid family serine protease [Candidatus Marivariicella framensis]|jgi:membrane associated rhomboid family serine protease|tara:strand:- start:453 stop:1313 length:861 start_codon:yes stop_codon:yes gene_type:complete
MGSMIRWKYLKDKYDFLSISEKLILINVLCFFIPFILNTILFLFNFSFGNLITWFELSPKLEVLLFKPWTLLTYSFFHTRISHLFWNMLLLYYASSIFLNLFKKETFINTYFLGVMFGGVLFVLSYLVFPVFQGSFPSMIGASAGVMAVLIFVCKYTPETEIRLLFFNVKLKYIGIALVAIDLVMIPYGNAGGRISHLGGAVLGYIYAKNLSQGTDIGYYFEKLWQYIVSFSSKSHLKTVYKSKKKSSKNVKVDQNEIDAILDKISNSGYESLTKNEKETLFNAGK